MSDCVSLICASPHKRDFTLQIASGDADVMVGAYVACQSGVSVKVLHYEQNTSEFASFLAQEYKDMVHDLSQTEIDITDTQMFTQKLRVHAKLNTARFLRVHLSFAEHEDQMREIGEGCIGEIAAELDSATGMPQIMATCIIYDLHAWAMR